jgi:dTMP kinase
MEPSRCGAANACRVVVSTPTALPVPACDSVSSGFSGGRSVCYGLGVSGLLITLEGVEGAGKTSQMMRLERWLRRQGRKVERTREPDGTRLGLAVRRLFERPGVKPEPLVEVFLFMAARQQHVAEKIRPWLSRGRVILCDRYADATVAYQGYGRGVDPDLIRELNVRATSGVLPDLTLLFDLDPAEGFRRIRGRRFDHFEREALAFHRRVRRGYLEIHRAEPKRVRLVHAGRGPDEVEAEVRAIVEDFFRGA